MPMRGKYGPPPSQEEMEEILRQAEIAREMEVMQAQQAASAPPVSAQPSYGAPQAAGMAPGMGMLDPERQAEWTGFKAARDRRSGIMAAQAEVDNEKSFGRNFLEKGALPILATVGTLGVGMLPMALAFGLGATLEEGKQQRAMNDKLDLDSATADYEMAAKGVDAADDMFGTGKNGTPAQTQHMQYMLEGLPANEQIRAKRIALGLEGRAAQAGYQMAKVVGPDGSERVGLWTRDGRFLIPNPASPGGWEDLGPGAVDTGAVRVWDDSNQSYVDPSQTAPIFPPGFAPPPPEGLEPRAPQGAPQGAPGTNAPPQQGSAPVGPQNGLPSPTAAPPGPAPAPGQPPISNLQAAPAPGPRRPTGVNPLIGPSTEQDAYDQKVGQLLAERDAPVPPAGWQVNPDGGFSLIPGSPAEREFMERKQNQLQLKEAFFQPLLRDITRALEVSDLFGHPLAFLGSTEGEGEIGPFRKGMEQYSPVWPLEQNLRSIRNSVSLINLQNIRDASPTGGALGQIPVKQQQMLGEIEGLLDPRADQDIGEQNLIMMGNTAIKRLAYAMYGSDYERQQAVRDGRMSKDQAAQLAAEHDAMIEEYTREADFDNLGKRKESNPEFDDPAPEGWDQEDWNYLPPEDRARLRGARNGS